jgi:hypothetical protein
MQDILATYLFQQKNCPLPGIGSLVVKEHAAAVMHGERKIKAPQPYIELSHQDIPATGLVKYIASEQKVSEDEAFSILKQYCRTLKYMGTHEEIKLPGAGHFHVSSDGNILFSADDIPAAYTLPVTAEKVIRPNDTHSMLVGDTETTNTVMNEFYSDDQPVSSNRWWIWAIVLAALSIAVIVFYINDSGANGSAGNGMKITPKPTVQAYR